MLTRLATLLFLLPGSVLVGQQSNIPVADLTIKLPGLSTEEVYYSFAEGDQLIFSLEETQGKTIKRIEISEEPDHSLYKDFQVERVDKKTIRVLKTGVYIFRVENGAAFKRVCKLHIERIPASDSTLHFNTGWTWKTVFDTTFVSYTEDSLVGHDTIYTTKMVKELVSDELVLQELLTNHGIEVHSKTYQWPIYSEGALNEEILQINLPPPFEKPYIKEETVTWSYGIGVNQQLKLKVQKTKSDLLNAGGNIATALGNPQFKIAFTVLDYATNDHSDQSIYCALIPDRMTANSFMADQPFKVFREDNIVRSEGIRVDNPLYGSPYLGFENSNYRQGITVYVNVAVWRRIRTYEDRERIEEVVTPRYVTRNKTRRVIKSSNVRVPQ